MGGRMWILNAGHIEKEYRKPMEGLLLQEKQWLGDCLEIYRLNNDMGKRWEETKNKIKYLSVMYCKERKQYEERREGAYEKMKMELSRADDEEGYSMEKYIEVKMELEKYERETCSNFK